MHPPVFLASLPFNEDLIDLILITLPDIHTLQSFVLCSKFVYSVFDSRRPSVILAVVSNHLGMVTRPATRLVKAMCDVGSYLYWHGCLSPLPATELPREEEFGPSNPLVIITMREVQVLAANHEIVKEFEALYSWRKKDPRSRSSRLTLRESARFQTALYRLWFVCALYGRPNPAYTSGNDTPEILRDIGQAQAEFLRGFAPFQMAPLFQAWKFVVELATWSVDAEFCHGKVATENPSLEAYLAWSGPKATLQAFHGELESVIDHEAVPALSASYEQFFNVFNAACPPKQAGTLGILEFPDGCFLSTLKCKQCGAPYSEDMPLWSKSNWDFLRGVVPPSELPNFVDIECWDDEAFTEPEVLESVCRDTPYSELMSIHFDTRIRDYKSWKPGHRLCRIECPQEFLRDNMEELFRYASYRRSSSLYQ